MKNSLNSGSALPSLPAAVPAAQDASLPASMRIAMAQLASQAPIRLRTLACLAILTAIPVSAGFSQSQNGSMAGGGIKDTSGISPLSRPQQTPGGSMDDNPQEPDSEKRISQLNAMRQKEMETDSAKLLTLATELKAAVDKSGKDTLSLDVVRKAEQIERLAHSVRDKMKASLSH